MRPNDFTVLLKIRHVDVDPDSLTEALGIVPEYSWRGGESKADDGDPQATRRETYWVARVPPMPPEVAWLEGTLMLAALLLARRKDFWTKLQAEGARAELVVVFGETTLSGFELPHELLSMLSKLGLSVSFDLRDAAEEAAA